MSASSIGTASETGIVINDNHIPATPGGKLWSVMLPGGAECRFLADHVCNGAGTLYFFLGDDQVAVFPRWLAYGHASAIVS